MRQRVTTLVLAALSSAFAIALALALAAAWPASQHGLLAAVQSALPESRVANPVTAVLLDYRGYDTLLELAVLLLAWMAAAATVADGHVTIAPGPSAERSMGRLLLVPMILVACYLLWAGADAPGGAFQAGAIGAAAFIAWHLSAGVSPGPRLVRLLAPLGFAVFLGIGLTPLILAGDFLDYPLAAVRELMLVVELGAMVSVAVILASLHHSVRASADDEHRP